MGTVRIGDAIGKGWEIYKNNFGLVFLASLLASLIAGVTCGICFGPLTCGIFLLLARLLKKSEPKPAVGDVFKGFEKFLPSFLLCLIAGICCFFVQFILCCIPFLGWLLSLVLSFAYGPILMWSLMLIANRGMKWTDAIGLVLKSTFNGSFTMPILLGIVAGLIGTAGLIACGIGMLFTLPLVNCIYAAAYEQVFGSAAPEAPAPGLPSSEPPAPEAPAPESAS